MHDSDDVLSAGVCMEFFSFSVSTYLGKLIKNIYTVYNYIFLYFVVLIIKGIVWLFGIVCGDFP